MSASHVLPCFRITVLLFRVNAPIAFAVQARTALLRQPEQKSLQDLHSKSCCTIHHDTCLDVPQHGPCRIGLELSCKALGSRTCTTERSPHIPFQSFFVHRPDSTVQGRRNGCRMTLADNMSTLSGPAVCASSASPHRHNSLYTCLDDQHYLPRHVKTVPLQTVDP